jgi:hypothetical protein
MKRLAPILAFIFAVTLLFGAAAALWEGGKRLAGYVATVPKEMGVALVAAAATIFVSTLTVVVGRYFERKKELDVLYRDKKVEIYDQFLKQLFASLHGAPTPESQEEEMVPFLREFMRKLLLWSGPEPISCFTKWKEHLARGVPDARTIFLTEEFLLAVRRDLRHSNRGIPT